MVLKQRKMKERDDILKEEKKMYSTSISLILLSFVLLVFINSGMFSSNVITGYVIHEDTKNITQQQALEAILEAEEILQEMTESGFNVVWFKDKLLEAKNHFEPVNFTLLVKEVETTNKTDSEKIQDLLNKAKSIGRVNYSLVLEKSAEIEERKEKAFELSDTLNALSVRLNELSQSGLLTEELSNLFIEAHNEFTNERFENAEKLIERINDKIAEKSAEVALLTTIYKAGKDNIINFVKENFIPIVLVLIIIIIVSFLSYHKIMIKIYNKKIKDSEIELDVLNDLTKKSQKDYFSKGIIPKSTYELKIGKYKERLSEIKRTIPVLKTKLEKMRKII